MSDWSATHTTLSAEAGLDVRGPTDSCYLFESVPHVNTDDNAWGYHVCGVSLCDVCIECRLTHALLSFSFDSNTT